MKSVQQIALRIPVELLDRLKTANPNLSEEIRLRLEKSFRSPDEATDDLLDLIAHAAGTAKFDGGWDQDPAAFAMFKAAVILLLDRQKPEGEPDPDKDWFITGPGVTAEVAGQILVNMLTKGWAKP